MAKTAKAEKAKAKAAAVRTVLEVEQYGQTLAASWPPEFHASPLAREFPPAWPFREPAAGFAATVWWAVGHWGRSDWEQHFAGVVAKDLGEAHEAMLEAMAAKQVWVDTGDDARREVSLVSEAELMRHRADAFAEGFTEGRRHRGVGEWRRKRGRPGETLHQVRELLMVELLARKGVLERDREENARGPYRTAIDAVFVAKKACEAARPVYRPIPIPHEDRYEVKEGGLYAERGGPAAAAWMISLLACTPTLAAVEGIVGKAKAVARTLHQRHKESDAGLAEERRRQAKLMLASGSPDIPDDESRYLRAQAEAAGAKAAALAEAREREIGPEFDQAVGLLKDHIEHHKDIPIPGFKRFAVSLEPYRKHLPDDLFP